MQPNSAFGNTRREEGKIGENFFNGNRWKKCSFVLHELILILNEHSTDVAVQGGDEATVEEEKEGFIFFPENCHGFEAVAYEMSPIQSNLTPDHRRAVGRAN